MNLAFDVLVVFMALAIIAGSLAFARDARSDVVKRLRQADLQRTEERTQLNIERKMLLNHYVEMVEKMTAFGRYELDAGERALKMQQIIDNRVKERTTTVYVDQDGKVVAGPAKRVVPEAGEQPPDPNVRTTTILDEVTEYEREMNRMVNPDIDWTKRDNFTQEQPLPPVEP
jgi:hypothetical protein